jgi:hypothetical protein
MKPVHRTDWSEYIDEERIKSIPARPPVQYDLHKQLMTLLGAGNRLGLYDAVDWVRHQIPDSKGK